VPFLKGSKKLTRVRLLSVQACGRTCQTELKLFWQQLFQAKDRMQFIIMSEDVLDRIFIQYQRLNEGNACGLAGRAKLKRYDDKR